MLEEDEEVREAEQAPGDGWGSLARTDQTFPNGKEERAPGIG